MPVPEPAGSIYDLGYRRYDGTRLGRGATAAAIYLASLRAAFGLGRRATAKIVPFALVVIVCIPALVQIGVAAATSGLDADIEILRHEDYFGYIQIILILFCAAVASELVGRDQRNRTLALYFSRGVPRADYALAKVAALTSAMLVMTLGPQLLLLVGNGMVDDDVFGYIRENLGLLPRILGASLLLSLVIAGVSLAIAAYLPRRSYATASIVAVFILTLAASGILIETTDSVVGRLAVLVGPGSWEGFVHWFFGVPPPFDGLADQGDFPGWAYAASGVAAALVSVGLCVRRFRRVAT